MKTKLLLFTLVFNLLFRQVPAQSYPVFGPEIKVNITGLSFDAMEPFISLDENILFFNSLNAGGNTNLYYATKVNDSTFNFAGLVGGTYDPSPNHLDAVASMDSLNNFFWVSLRGYPLQMENLHKGLYAGGSVSNITRVYGNFNIYEFNYPFGWLIMDGSINYHGNYLCFNNAKFDFSDTICVGVPCEAKRGIAQKVNDSTFYKLDNSDAIFIKVNDTITYIIYAPQSTKYGLDLYFSRLRKGTTDTEICVAVRNTPSDTFSLPATIYSNIGFVPEAPCPTSDKKKIYYHQKDQSGLFRIFLRYRISLPGIFDKSNEQKLKVYPNPSDHIVNVELPNQQNKFTISIYDLLGQKIYETTMSTNIDISQLSNGIYFLKLSQHSNIWTTKIIKGKP